jgi:hypothetical protein
MMNSPILCSFHSNLIKNRKFIPWGSYRITVIREVLIIKILGVLIETGTTRTVIICQLDRQEG